jgi:hypothetical protein
MNLQEESETNPRVQVKEDDALLNSLKDIEQYQPVISDRNPYDPIAEDRNEDYESALDNKRSRE